MDLWKFTPSKQPALSSEGTAPRWWKGPTRTKNYQGSIPKAVATPAPIQQDLGFCKGAVNSVYATASDLYK